MNKHERNKKFDQMGGGVEKLEKKEREEGERKKNESEVEQRKEKQGEAD